IGLCLVHFFFFCLGAHGALRSFPTRRSSDLSASRVAAFSAFSLSGRLTVITRTASWSAVSSGVSVIGWSRGAGGRRRAELAGPRSEEHTSELQSRENLVCRLLLEKKNRHMTR